MLYLKKAEVIREFQELYSLRYRVFCLEKHGLEPSDYPDKKEKDKYDAYASHYVAIGDDRKVKATVRIIIDSDSPSDLPVMDHPGIFMKDINTARCMEISKFAVDRGFSKEDVFLGFLRAIYQYSLKQNISNWLLNIDPGLLYMLKGLSFGVFPLGRPQKHQGDVSVPVRWDLSDVEGSIRLKNNILYEWLQKDAKCISEENDLSSLLNPTYFSYINHDIAIARG